MTGQEPEGLEYFRDAQALTDGLDGREVIRGFLDGLKSVPPVAHQAIPGGLPWRTINDGGRG